MLWIKVSLHAIHISCAYRIRFSCVSVCVCRSIFHWKKEFTLQKDIQLILLPFFTFLPRESSSLMRAWISVSVCVQRVESRVCVTQSSDKHNLGQHLWLNVFIFNESSHLQLRVISRHYDTRCDVPKSELWVHDIQLTSTHYCTLSIRSSTLIVSASHSYIANWRQYYFVRTSIRIRWWWWWCALSQFSL